MILSMVHLPVEEMIFYDIQSNNYILFSAEPKPL